MPHRHRSIGFPSNQQAVDVHVNHWFLLSNKFRGFFFQKNLPKFSMNIMLPSARKNSARCDVCKVYNDVCDYANHVEA
jgi:hypothetical protein